jgi:hypothetical protein
LNLFESLLHLKNRGEYQKVLMSDAYLAASIHKVFELKSNSHAWGCGAFASTGFDMLIWPLGFVSRSAQGLFSWPGAISLHHKLGLKSSGIGV